MMTIKKERQRGKSSEKHFNSLKEESEKRKKLIWCIMLRVNIFFMLFEKLLYVTKELLLMLLIFLSALTDIKLLSLFLPKRTNFSVDISALQKLIYSMDQLTKISIEIC